MNDVELDLPDWSGMDDTSTRVTPEAAFRLCENYPALASGRGQEMGDDTQERVVVEFVL